MAKSTLEIKIDSKKIEMISDKIAEGINDGKIDIVYAGELAALIAHALTVENE